MKTIFIAIIFVLLAVIIYMAKCGGNKNIDSKFEEQHAQDSIRIQLSKDTIKQLKIDIDYQSAIIMDKDSTLLVLGDEVDLLMKRRNKVVNKNASGVDIVIDTSEYLNECDQCFTLLKRGKDSVASYVKEVKKRDSLQAQHDSAYARLGRNYESTIANLLQKYRSLYSNQKIRSFSTGIEFVYSPAYTNAGVWLEYKDKRGKIFGLNGGRNSLQSWYAGAKVGFELFHFK